MKLSQFLWALGFLLILIATQATSFIDFSKEANLLGLPSWLWFFVGIHLVYIVLLFMYSRNNHTGDTL